MLDTSVSNFLSSHISSDDSALREDTQRHFVASLSLCVSLFLSISLFVYEISGPYVHGTSYSRKPSESICDAESFQRTTIIRLYLSPNALDVST